jgi:hypothetical protein
MKTKTLLGIAGMALPTLLLALSMAMQVRAAPPATPDNAAVAALNLSNSATDSRNPAIAVGSGSARSVVWEETVDISPTLSMTFLRHRAWNGVAWTPVVTVSTGSRPDLAIGPDGIAHLVWTDDFGGASRVFYSNWNGTTWATPKIIAPLVTGDATAPAIAVDSANTVYVTWGEFQVSGFVLYYASSTSGGAGAWSAQPVPLATGDAPDITMGVTNTAHLVWQQTVSGTREIFYAALNGTSWSLPENVSQTPPDDSILPAIALLPDGRPIVAWSELIGGSQLDVESSVRTDAGWTGVVDVSNTSDDSARPRLAGAGPDMAIVWDEVATPATVQWAFGSGGGWSFPLPVVSGGGNWGGANLAGGADGTFHVAYDGGPSVNGDVLYNALSLLHVFLPTIRR